MSQNLMLQFSERLNLSKLYKLFVLIFLLSNPMGCTAFRDMGRVLQGQSANNSPKLSAILTDEPKIVTQVLARSQLEESVQGSFGRDVVRIVRIFRRNAVQGIPEHRIFDVKKGSPLHLFGLRNGDVIVGINDRLIPQPEILMVYPQAVLRDGVSTLTFNRLDKMYRLDITLSEDESH